MSPNGVRSLNDVRSPDASGWTSGRIRPETAGLQEVEHRPDRWHRARHVLGHFGHEEGFTLDAEQIPLGGDVGVDGSDPGALRVVDVVTLIALDLDIPGRSPLIPLGTSAVTGTKR